MRHAITALILGAGFLAASAVSAEDMSGNTQFVIGQRYLRDAKWGTLDSPTVFGIEVDFAPSSSPVHVAMGVMVSGESGTGTIAEPMFGETGSVDSRFFEFSAGFLWHPVKKAIVRPYLGAGAVILTASNTSDWGAFSSGSHSDTSFGWYGNAGVFFKVGEHFNIGVDGRAVRGTKITLSGIEGNADYEQVGMLLGFSWGHSPAPPPPPPAEE